MIDSKLMRSLASFDFPAVVSRQQYFQVDSSSLLSTIGLGFGKRLELSDFSHRARTLRYAAMSSPTAELLRLLSRPGPPITVQKVDFRNTDLPGNADLYAVILDNVLTAEECQQLVAAAEASTNGVWEQAMVNIGNYQQELRTDVRDCGRIIWDDKEVAGVILERVKRFVPEIKSLTDMPLITGNGPVKRKETWHLSRPNERLRLLKYGPGQYFRGKKPISLPTFR